MNIQLDMLTESKASFIFGKGDHTYTGVVLRDKDGNMVIVEQAAVRRVDKEKAWELMHPNQSTTWIEGKNEKA